MAGPEVTIEVLPRLAAVEMDGRGLGRGPGPQPVPDRSRRHRFRAWAEGFEPLQAEVEGEHIAGRTLFLVLRPAGFGSERRLEAGDMGGLARAAAHLLRAGRAREAADYATQSLAAGENALAHRVLGAAHARLGDRTLAIRHYGAYLSLAPDAPDASEVRRAVEAARGDIALPAGKEDRAAPPR